MPPLYSHLPQHVREKKGMFTGLTSAQDLMKWIKEKYVSAPKIKGNVLTAAELVKESRATDWEIANLLYIELTAMGYACKLLYMETKHSAITHTVVLYRNGDNQWRWYEWRSSVDCGVCGPYTCMTDAVIAAKVAFDVEWLPHKFSSIGEGVVFPGMTAEQYIEMVKAWKRPPRRKPVKA